MKRFAIVALTVLVFCASPGRTPANADSPVRNDLSQSIMKQRAFEAVIWGMPAVNYDLMLREMLTKTPGKVGQVIYWGRSLDSRHDGLSQLHQPIQRDGSRIHAGGLVLDA